MRSGPRLFAAALDRARDLLLSARDLDGIRQAALAISRSMRDEATDWYFGGALPGRGAALMTL